MLYNPTDGIFLNIQSYINNVDMLYAVDNSERPDIEIIDKIKALSNKIEYIPLGDNYGIAKALNVGALKAIDSNCSWLLTMDQDGKFRGDSIYRIIEYINSREYNEKTAIVSPFHANKFVLNPKETVPEAETVLDVMTSGNFLNLKAYRANGEFDEKLFIDAVDDEYCLRLNMNGYNIIKINACILEHELGCFTKQKYFFGKKVTPTNHNPLRRYYMTRNRLHICKKYKNIVPVIVKKLKRAMFNEAIKIILYEDKKIKKIMAMIFGYTDFKKGKTGKYNGKIKLF